MHTCSGNRAPRPHAAQVCRSALARHVRAPSRLLTHSHRLLVEAVSDLHCNHEENIAVVRSWVSRAQQHAASNDDTQRVLLFAGDISDSLDTVASVLRLLKTAYDHVVFVPGNHEAWVKGSAQTAPDSPAKLRQVLGVCDELGVHVRPVRFGQLLVIPLHSWHHASWDKEPDIPGSLVPRATALTVSDYARCVWPVDSEGHSGNGGLQTAALLDSWNDQPPVPNNRLDVITMSHFLPCQSLLPEKRFLTWPNLAKAVGSDYLLARIRHLRPVLHVFGHTHFAWDATLPDCGVRCIQAPLGYPSERRRRMRSLVVNSPWQATEGGASPVQALSWLPLHIATAEYALAPVSISTAPQPQPCQLAAQGEEVQLWKMRVVPETSAMWSDHYKAYARTPEDVQLAPWVAPRYARRLRMSKVAASNRADVGDNGLRA